MSSRLVVMEPSAPWVLVTLSTRCAPGGPTGITIRPPDMSCCSRGGGAWSIQEGPDGRLPPDVLVADQGLEAVPALAEEHRILAAGLAPGDEVLACVGRRI